MLAVLILAWFLTLFNVDTLFVSGLNEFLGTNYSTNVYWLAAIVIAVIICIVERVKGKN